VGDFSQRQIWRTTVAPQRLHHTLKKGGWFAGAGALLLLLAAIVFPASLLKILGIPLFFTGILLIAIGWLPYRKLVQLQIKPHELHYDGEALTYCINGRPQFNLDERDIEKIVYCQKESYSGIALWLKRPLEHKIKLLQRRIDATPFSGEGKEREGCDLFFPDFSQRTFEEILEYMFIDQPESGHAS
jgi:hypothetical protein